MRNNVKVAPKDRVELENAILQMHVMPSMRCLMTSGPALERDNMAGFNCAYTVIDSPRAFDEALYIMMCGSGLGFSVERQYVDKLPIVPDNLRLREGSWAVPDSKFGWADGLRHLFSSIFHAGAIPDWDLSRLRKSGERLKTFGGRASGPEPLDALFHFVVKTCLGAQGRRLTPMECHDVMCMIAQAVIAGGVRRSAMISLSNLGDNELRLAKTGDWYAEEQQPYRAFANNSVVYSKRPDMSSFMEEWHSLYRSKSGERGIFNREAARVQVGKYGRREPNHQWGTNPCSEIILRPHQVCNLSEVIIRNGDSLSQLKEKVRLATILGTYQSTLTSFRYLRKVWQDNTEEERLLGVSLTGIMDHKVLNNTSDVARRWLRELRKVANETNQEYAKKWGIEPSTAITCVKPSGTVSQLVDSASGIHSRHSPHYIRTVRADKRDPLTQFLQDQGVPVEDALSDATGNTAVFSFPVEAPAGSLFRSDVGAIVHLELWKMYAEEWCEHKPSITVSVKDTEWMAVGAWVWEHFDSVSGISFLPYSDHMYAQAPYQECSLRDYKLLLRESPTAIDWGRLKDYEEEDNTAGSQTLACTGTVCEVVDIGDV